MIEKKIPDYPAPCKYNVTREFDRYTNRGHSFAQTTLDPEFTRVWKENLKDREKQKNDSPGPGHYVVNERQTTKKKITTFPKMEKRTIFWIEENDLGPGRYLPLNG